MWCLGEVKQEQKIDEGGEREYHVMSMWKRCWTCSLRLAFDCSFLGFCVAGGVVFSQSLKVLVHTGIWRHMVDVSNVATTKLAGGLSNFGCTIVRWLFYHAPSFVLYFGLFLFLCCSFLVGVLCDVCHGWRVCT